jgi:hypothetical protein
MFDKNTHHCTPKKVFDGPMEIFAVYYPISTTVSNDTWVILAYILKQKQKKLVEAQILKRNNLLSFFFKF